MLTGIYKAVVVATWLAESSKKKTPYVNLKFSVADGDGSTMTAFLPIWISDAAIGMARKSLKLLGFDVDRESIYTLSNGSTKLAGHEFEVEAYEEEYKGEIKTKFRMPMGDSPLLEEAARYVDKMLRAAKSADEVEPDGVTEKPKATKPARSPRRIEPTDLETMAQENLKQTEANPDDPNMF